MKAALMRVIRDYRVTAGGPDGAIETLASFQNEELITVSKTSREGEYPDMYEIKGCPGKEFSRGVISSFLAGFAHATTAQLN